jgi:hypothetical protein
MRIDRDDLGELNEIGVGGQGKVYDIVMPGAPWPMVYKEYALAIRTQVDAGVLERLIAVATPGLHAWTAWPTALVTDQGQVTGFLMRRVPADYHLRVRAPDGQQSEVLGQVQHLLNDDAFLSYRLVAIHDRWRLEFLRDTAQRIGQLHASAIVIGDLSPMNLLSSFVAKPRCFFIDCDAMQADGRSVLPQVETTGWEVPSGERTATPEADAFKFALLAIRLFARDQEARDPAFLSAVSPALQQLAARALGADPRTRPAPDEWVPALEAAMATASTVLPWEQPTVAYVAPAPPPFTVPMPPPSPLPPHPVVPPPPRRRRGRWVLAVVALLAIFLCSPYAANLISKAGAAQNTGAAAGGTQTTDRGTTQAAAVQEILSAAKADRTALVGAVQQITDCRDVAAAIGVLGRVGEGRRAELAKAQALQIDALSRGTELAATLVDALTHSIAADEAFTKWGNAVRSSGCSKATRTGGQRTVADNESKLATAAKKRFVGIWAPIAQRYGYPVIAYTDV